MYQSLTCLGPDVHKSAGERTILIEGDQNQGVLHELLVGLHGVDKLTELGHRVGDVGVVGIVLQVGSVEHVLRSVLAQGHILGEVVLGVDDVLAAGGVVADVVEGHEWVVLALSSIRLRHWMVVCETYRT